MSGPLLGSMPEGYRALVVAAGGGIGAAFIQKLQSDPRCAQVLGLGRKTVPAIDFEQEASIAAAAAELAPLGPFQLIINAAGILHSPEFMPEKQLAHLSYTQLLSTFTINTLGPALLLRYFSPLLDRQRGVMAMLSAKVGSIEDNRLGGWYSYRASKAALNMLIKTAAIELRRSQPQTVLVALHPGTVSSALSAPFRGAEIGRPAAVAAAEMLAVLDGLTPADSGHFLSYSGERLPW
ncbi:SDR family NAD(P)-dependent oxidoreductase [Roseateles oligotrophus]|uniref:SDR family NAD(P)-dependent oxidoreductase n=1 Tax=Roseateles oligotrophus TaxID=1769250 RepID=A0ABT2Y9V0_9BURK|nr:SDR family NAD(P)-dependent oxidoreductase [Roseateles oligotrophus]MCV2367077.1 SDR family NAD(P)-dependent oxidoreductase [Roseateles oligotrophus]